MLRRIDAPRTGDSVIEMRSPKRDSPADQRHRVARLDCCHTGYHGGRMRGQNAQAARHSSHWEADVDTENRCCAGENHRLPSEENVKIETEHLVHIASRVVAEPSHHGRLSRAVKRSEAELSASRHSGRTAQSPSVECVLREGKGSPNPALTLHRQMKREQSLPRWTAQWSAPCTAQARRARRYCPRSGSAGGGSATTDHGPKSKQCAPLPRRTAGAARPRGAESARSLWCKQPSAGMRVCVQRVRPTCRTRRAVERAERVHALR
jgi:hypothetical protein